MLPGLDPVSGVLDRGGSGGGPVFATSPGAATPGGGGGGGPPRRAKSGGGGPGAAIDGEKSEGTRGGIVIGSGCSRGPPGPGQGSGLVK